MQDYPPADPAYRPVPVATDETVIIPPPGGRGSAALLVAFGIGGAVAVALGAYGRLHEPTFIAVNLAGFSGPLAVKAWMATGAAALAVVQLVSALAMYGKRCPWSPRRRGPVACTDGRAGSRSCWPYRWRSTACTRSASPAGPRER